MIYRLNEANARHREIIAALRAIRVALERIAYPDIWIVDGKPIIGRPVEGFAGLPEAEQPRTVGT